MTHPNSAIFRPRFLIQATATMLVLAATSVTACSDNKDNNDPSATGGGGSGGTDGSGGKGNTGGMGEDLGGQGGMGGDSLGGEGGMGQSDCYSPAEPDDAVEHGAQGCTCNGYEDKSVCVGPAALICSEGKWISVEDGPCFPTIEPCDGTTDTWQSCLAEFNTCAETNEGDFCGR